MSDMPEKIYLYHVHKNGLVEAAVFDDKNIQVPLYLNAEKLRERLVDMKEDRSTSLLADEYIEHGNYLIDEILNMIDEQKEGE